MANCKRIIWTCALVLVTGCADDLGPEHDVEHVDAGTLCVYADGPSTTVFSQPQRFEAGDTLVVTVQAPECLSRSCDVNRVAECSIDRIGNVLEVTSYLGYDEVGGESCTMDCVRLTATCESDALEQGHYSILFGDSLHRFSIPSQVNEPCL